MEVWAAVKTCKYSYSRLKRMQEDPAFRELQQFIGQCASQSNALLAVFQ